MMSDQLDLHCPSVLQFFGYTSSTEYRRQHQTMKAKLAPSSKCLRALPSLGDPSTTFPTLGRSPPSAQCDMGHT
jgi:hypothetical protein